MSVQPTGAAERSELAAVCEFCGGSDLVEFSERPAARCLGCGSLERHRGLARLLAELLPEGGGGRRVLEIGPLNTRVFGDYLRARGWHYVSVDLTLRGNPFDPRETGFVDIEADLCDLRPIADASIDLLMAQHVIEEITDYRAALSEVARVLAPGGLAVLEIPFNPDLPHSQSQPPGAFGNVWRFGADLHDAVRERFSTVEVRGYVEGAFRGERFICGAPR